MMTRKSAKISSALRPCSWKATLMKRACNEKDRVLNVSISASNSKRWSELKIKLGLEEDSDLIDYLLTLAETLPRNGSSSDGDEWWRSNGSTRKKSTRGPTLRAVLRRSSRHENESEEKPVEIQSSNSHLRSKSSKKNAHSKSDKKIKFKVEEDKEQKASQLDAELALLVETVALPCASMSSCSASTENEPYEFKDDCLPKNSPENSNISPLTDKGKKILKAGCKRWKSYHKDKRKWKQSYAAVLEVGGPSEAKPPEDERLSDNVVKSSDEPEKERRIFKGLKKKRILTAYLDSQNKIATQTVKEPCVSDKDEVPVLSRESEGNSETSSNQEMPKLQCESISKTEGTVILPTENDDCRVTTLSCERVRVSCDAGKENQEECTMDEPAPLEVGERVKFKKRKKRWNTKEGLIEGRESHPREKIEKNIDDVGRHHHKRLKGKRKHDVVLKMDEDKFESKDPKEDTSKILDSSESELNICSDSSNQKEEKAHSCDIDENDSNKNEMTEAISSSKSSEQADSAVDEPSDQLSIKVKNCSYCFSRHIQQICPIEYPNHKLGDAITLEQWQFQCQVQVRCSVIESPRDKHGRTRKCAPDHSTSINNDEIDRKPARTKKETDDCLLYAEESLPIGLSLQVIDEEHGKSVIARAPVAQYTLFGPLVGPVIQEKDISDESDMKHIWEVLNGKDVNYINTDDPQKSNWLRFIRPAPVRERRNLTVAVKDGKLYFVSILDINVGDELLFWSDDHVTSWSRKKILKSSCGGCNMRFAHPLYYRTHCAVFHDPSHSLTIRKYHCKVCGEAVLGKENIMKHAADRHEGRGAYQCQFCHKFFLRLNYLEMHRTYGCSSNPHRNRPLCDFCGRYFCQPQKLKVHIKRMHSDMSEVLKEFQCKSCLKILGSRAALQRHFKEVHHRDVVVSSSCERCGKSFQNRSNLKIHMLTHSGVKPFRCQLDGCSSAFTTKQCLQFHYKKAHNLSEDAVPRIERSIAYTFDAYAGETEGGCAIIQPKRTVKSDRKGRKSASKSKKTQSHSMPLHEQESNHNVALPAVELTTEKHFTEEHARLQDHMEPNHCQEEIPQMNGFCGAMEVLPVPQPSHHALMPYKAEADASNGSSSPPAGVLMGLHYGQEDKQPMYSKTLTPIMMVNHRYSPLPPSPRSMSPPPRCPSPSPGSRSNSPSPGLRAIISLGRKKWLGEAIEVAEEAAAAAMQLSPRVRRDLYDLDEEKLKSKHIYLEDAMRLDVAMDAGLGHSRAGLIASKPALALAPFHHPGSASLLVEAALDAAERDICCATSASKHPAGEASASPPEPRAQPVFSPSHYPLVHPHPHSPEPHPLIHPMDAYGMPVSPVRLYDAHAHQMLHQGSASSDEEGCTGVDADCNAVDGGAQNLSLNLKAKPDPHVDVPVMYGMPYQEHVPLPQQSDLNFSAAMGAPGQPPSPRYHMYDLSCDRETVDLSLTSRTGPSDHSHSGYSMDLSLPRSHTPSYGHLHHPGPHPGPAYSPAPAPSPGPPYSSHPLAFQVAPLQRADSPPAPAPALPAPAAPHYHSYGGYY